MRKYNVIFTADKLDFPKFNYGLGRYVLMEQEIDSAAGAPAALRSTHNIPEKGKQKAILQDHPYSHTKERKGSVSLLSQCSEGGSVQQRVITETDWTYLVSEVDAPKL